MIVGTAGHIDHGKTALVRRMTGIDTDRLPEEKKRGMTIDLGFAHLELEGVGKVGIVDVPGHERFISNMVAGATGIDLVLLVIAADDGVMPQTREHLDIVSLLGITNGVVALSKIDLVPAARVKHATEDIRALLAGTPLASAPVVSVSAETGAGVETLLKELAGSLGMVRAKSETGPFWMALDRVFVAQGFGVVGTGTVASGRVAKDAQLRLLPGGQAVRVRGIQIHNQSVDAAAPGNRCALNLTGVDKNSLRRGMVACDPRLIRVAATVDARVTLVRDLGKPLKSHSRVRVHSGTAETLAHLQWLEEAQAQPGNGGLAQLRLEKPIPLLYGHRFVLRDETAERTLGGGVVLDPFAARRGAQLPERTKRLRRLSTLDLDESLDVWLAHRGAEGWLVTELAEQLAEIPERLSDHLAKKSGLWMDKERGAGWVVLQSAVEALGLKLVGEVGKYLHKNHRTTAMAPATLRSAVCPRLDLRIFRALLDRLAVTGELEITGEGIRPIDHQQTFSPEDEALAGRIEELLIYRDRPPPKLEALTRALKQSAPRLRRFLGELERARRVVRLADGVYTTHQDLEGWRKRVESLLQQHERVSVAQFRDEVEIGRGFAIMVLEQFDREGITRRLESVRVVGPAGTSEQVKT